jgi:hypothetical protein
VSSTNKTESGVKHHNHNPSYLCDIISVVIVSFLSWSAGDCGFEPWSGQTKDYKIGIYCSSTKLASLRSKSKDWLAWNQNNLSELSDMYTHELLFQ